MLQQPVAVSGAGICCHQHHHHLAGGGQPDEHGTQKAAMLTEVVERELILKRIQAHLVPDGVSRLRHQKALFDIKHLVEDPGDMKPKGGTVGRCSHAFALPSLWRLHRGYFYRGSLLMRFP